MTRVPQSGKGTGEQSEAQREPAGANEPLNHDGGKHLKKKSNRHGKNPLRNNEVFGIHRPFWANERGFKS